ncbi:hypothetical protein BU23DRAFT_543353 [Bimuria novae-zelandiae CBS 107.79]|uniref:C3H1-type domain-containing protein n=1 Tax=Bimuria novae-zelandiae CBS 107.79 TaxID=1447943 RepID=A0A6A5UR06_9PLEO|nr:hypothetical protein BU23DRAFT_543353 [Bimuria novae-zelandiae CBS 107.79]
MLGAAKLDSLDTRLEQFKLSNQNSQHELQTLLKEYSQLLEDYKVLWNAKIREASKSNSVSSNASSSPVLEKPRNPYVLVLIDGNGYVFNDELVKDKEEGGMRAARMLNDVVEKLLREQPQARDARVIARVYADITNVSKQLAKMKVIGLEKRSLMPFAAGFTRALGGFDFMDSLDEEGTRFKIRETFKFAAEDTACSHILFAACHDTNYLPQLVPYNGLQNKITLIQGAGFDTEFYQLGLTVAQFPTIFRWSKLVAAPSTTKGSSSVKAPSTKASAPARDFPKTSALDRDDWRSTSVGADSVSYDANGVIVGIPDFAASDGFTSKAEATKKTKPCRYFQKGFCRWGNKCAFVHAPSPTVPILTPTAPNRTNISSYLPATLPPNFIALNKDAHRLDAYLRPPTPAEWLVYNARFHRQKPCNAHHLSGTCTNFACPFDHHPLEVETQYCLEYVLKCSPCPRRGACRIAECVHGHVCQKEGCVGQAKGCKLKADAHVADLKVASMVPAEVEELPVPGEEFGGEDGGGGAGVGVYEGAW